MDVVSTITLAGPLRIRRASLRMPGDATMRFRLGTAYVSDLRIGLGPLTAVRGLDAFVDGTGMTRIGKACDMGMEIDQGAFLALWAQSVLFPRAWDRLPGLRWTALDSQRARVTLPFAGGEETATVSFDPEGTAFPVAFEADRYRVIGGPKIGWRVDYADWHWRTGVALPTRLVVTWADQPAPWFDMHLDEVGLNEPIDDDLERARTAIAAGRGRPTPGG